MTPESDIGLGAREDNRSLNPDETGNVLQNVRISPFPLTPDFTYRSLADIRTFPPRPDHWKPFEIASTPIDPNAVFYQIGKDPEPQHTMNDDTNPPRVPITRKPASYIPTAAPLATEGIKIPLSMQGAEGETIEATGVIYPDLGPIESVTLKPDAAAEQINKLLCRSFEIVDSQVTGVNAAWVALEITPEAIADALRISLATMQANGTPMPDRFQLTISKPGC